MSSWLGWS